MNLVSIARRAVSRSKAAFSGGYGGSYYPLGSPHADSWKKDKFPTPLELIREFVGIAYGCIEINANAVASTPLRLYARTGKGQPKLRFWRTARVSAKQLRHLRENKTTGPMMGADAEIVEVKNHPVLQLLDIGEKADSVDDGDYSDTRPALSGYLLFKLTQVYLDMMGRAYWLFEFDGAGVPTKTWLLRPQFVREVFDPDGTGKILYYEYGGPNGAVYDPQQILRFANPDPYNPYVGGMSPMMAAIDKIRIFRRSDASINAILENAARPDAIWSPKGDSEGGATIGMAEARRMEIAINQKFKEAGAGSIFVQPYPGTLTPLGWKPGEIITAEQLNQLRTDICFDFQIPDTIVNRNASNLASAKTGEWAHAKYGIQPRLNVISSAIRSVIRLYDDRGEKARMNPNQQPGNRLFLAYDNVLPNDEVFALEQTKAGADIGVAEVGELRSALDLEPFGDDRDKVRFINSSMVALGADGLPPPKPAAPAPGDKPDDADKPTKAENDAMKEAVKSLADEVDRLKKNEPDFAPDITAPPAFTRALRRIFDRQRNETLEEISKVKSFKASDLPPVDHWVTIDGEPVPITSGGGGSAEDRGLGKSGGIAWEKPKHFDGRKHAIIHVDPKKLLAHIKQTQPDHYVGPGGVGESAKPGAYAGVARHVEGGGKLDAPEVHFDKGRAQIKDGRHRLAYANDKGAKTIPVMVNKGGAKEMARRFGVDSKLFDQAWVKDDPHEGETDEEEEAREAAERYLNSVQPLLDMTDWTATLAQAAAPFLMQYSQEAVADMIDALPKPKIAVSFDVVDRNIPKAVQAQALKFCKATNDTTTKELNDALDELRGELKEGITLGDTQTQMRKRVQAVFTDLDTDRAKMIAQNEASNARHAAQLMTVQQSGVSKGKSWLRSEDCCEICEGYAQQGIIPLDQPFGVTSYGAVMHPIAHVLCACSLKFHLKSPTEIDAAGIANAGKLLAKDNPNHGEGGRFTSGGGGGGGGSGSGSGSAPDGPWSDGGFGKLNTPPTISGGVIVSGAPDAMIGKKPGPPINSSEIKVGDKVRIGYISDQPGKGAMSGQGGEILKIRNTMRGQIATVRGIHPQTGKPHDFKYPIYSVTHVIRGDSVHPVADNIEKMFGGEVVFKEQSRIPAGQPGAGEYAGGAAIGGTEEEDDRSASRSRRAVPGQMHAASREGSGKDAKIVMSDGSALPEHISIGMIPPAYSHNIQISKDASADVWATSEDAEGNSKKVYNPKFEKENQDIKWGRTREGVKNNEAIKGEIQKDRADPVHANEADAAWLMSEQGTRPGSEADTKGNKAQWEKPIDKSNIIITPAKDGKGVPKVSIKVGDETTPIRDEGARSEIVDRVKNGQSLENAGFWLKSHGATTLEGRHVVPISGGGAKLQFMGKEGVWHDHQIQDAGLAKTLLARKASAGDRGSLFNTNAAATAKYVGGLGDGKFSPKDLRTIKANTMAQGIVGTNERVFDSDKSRKSAIMEVGEKVSRVLGNRPQQALSTYIDPTTFDHWKVKS